MSCATDGLSIGLAIKRSRFRLPKHGVGILAPLSVNKEYNLLAAIGRCHSAAWEVTVGLSLAIFAWPLVTI